MWKTIRFRYVGSMLSFKSTGIHVRFNAFLLTHWYFVLGSMLSFKLTLACHVRFNAFL